MSDIQTTSANLRSPGRAILEEAGVARPVIITCALTGGVHGKEAHPALPEQPDEIVRAAVSAQAAGAAIVHCHARATNGDNTGDPDVFARILEGLRAHTDLIVNFTTGGGPGQSFEERLGVIDVAPDIVSLNMGTMLYQLRGEPEEPFINTRAEIEEIARRAAARGIKPELEVYSTTMLSEVANLVASGRIAAPYQINAVLNTPMQGGERGTVWEVVNFALRLPEPAVFFVTACGRTQLPLTTLAMLIGGHVRVGFEDNIYYGRGELATDNAQLVTRSARLAGELGLQVASPDQARAMLGLAANNGKQEGVR
jgi:3-keto-5-aminohexanoate cleavage enzyme